MWFLLVLSVWLDGVLRHLAAGLYGRPIVSRSPTRPLMIQKNSTAFDRCGAVIGYHFASERSNEAFPSRSDLTCSVYCRCRAVVHALPVVRRCRLGRADIRIPELVGPLLVRQLG